MDRLVLLVMALAIFGLVIVTANRLNAAASAAASSVIVSIGMTDTLVVLLVAAATAAALALWPSEAT